jgi:outer membrane biosynthesis protein TonB
LDRDCKPYLDQCKWWGPSLLIHALVAAAVLHPFSPDEKSASSRTIFDKISIVFEPQPQTPIAPMMPNISDSPEPYSSAPTTTTRTGATGKTPIKNDIPATQFQPKIPSEQITPPIVLPKPRPTASKKLPSLDLEKAKASSTDTAPPAHAPQSSAKIPSSNFYQKSANTLNKINIPETNTADTTGSARTAQNEVKSGVNTIKNDKHASLSTPTLHAEPIAPNTPNAGSAAPPNGSIDMDQVKVWGQHVRGALIKLTKGLKTRGSAKVEIRLARTGKLIGVTFVEKSQNARFNKELNRRIKTLAIFPAAPSGIATEEMLFPIRLTVTR